MKKIKYFYNTHTLRFERLITPLRVKLLRVFGLFAAVAVAAFFATQLIYRYFPSANEKRLMNANARLEEELKMARQELDNLGVALNEIEQRDNEVYRAIFEASPIPDSARAKALEKEKQEKINASLSDNDLNESIQGKIKTLKNRIDVQASSFAEITEMVKNKEVLLASTPAIQPVSNKNLNRLSSGFGYRIDPVYKTTKMHAGLDFAAPQGTPVYATGNGTIKLAGNTGNGYGNHVIIKHGFSYETLYGHLYRIKVRTGGKVKRGEVIGWVGNSGKSTGPHLHYEVHKNGRPLDPIYFFYNDLNPEQFDRMLKIAAASNQSLD
ncbi:MAG: M23 family metallopeptidase [Bacteroidota bacterium]|jgi:murein DD-endopeptidase MepM/ murein hydrolase activator NlpD